MKTSLSFRWFLLIALIPALSLVSCGKKKDPAPAGGGQQAPPPAAIDPPVSVYSGRLELAGKRADNRDPKCLLNLVNGNVYPVSMGAAVADSVDMLWISRTVYPSQKYFVTPDDTYVFHSRSENDFEYWEAADIYPGWTVRNATRLNDYGKTGFEHITTQSQMEAYLDDVYASGILTYVPFEGSRNQLERTYYFETSRSGVRHIGLLRIIRSDLAQGWADFQIRVMPYN